MVKEGPCCHCWVTSSPLWRNGPPTKRVLCNACATRWRAHGVLDGYIPKHGMSHNTQSSDISEGSQTDLSYTNQANTDVDSLRPSVPNFKNVPHRRRSLLNQRATSIVELLRRQLYGIPCKKRQVFIKEEVFIYPRDNLMSTPYETPLGAVLLNSKPKDGNQGASSST